MERNSFWGFVILGISICLGITSAGLCMSIAFYNTRATEHFVTVKGLAERNVIADLAIWPLTFKETGNDLTALNRIVDSKRQTIRQFLLDAGFEDSEISLSAPTIRDSQAEPIYGDQTVPKYPYVAQQTVSIGTNKVPLVKQTMEKSGELVGKGIVLVAGRGTEFLFTSLNKIKPDMIVEATKNARKATEQFAQDSGSKVDKIRKASQGLFTINIRDRNSPENKVVRVVTTVEYYIVDN